MPEVEDTLLNYTISDISDSENRILSEVSDSSSDLSKEVSEVDESSNFFSVQDGQISEHSGKKVGKSVKWQRSKKVRQLKEARTKITIFNKFNILTDEDEGFKVPSSKSNEENLQDPSFEADEGTKILKKQNGGTDELRRKKGMEEKKSSCLEVLDKLLAELPYSIVAKKHNGKSRKCTKINELKSLKAFEHENRFSLLENNQEEDLVDLKTRLKEIKVIKEMKRSQLKKCRACNTKKRTCKLDKSSCRALDKRCNFCNKIGHFPNSLNCKKMRKIKLSKQKQSFAKVKSCFKKIDADKVLSSEEIGPAILKKIRTRISQLQSTEIALTDTYCRQQVDFNHLIPFIMMYIFLNYDFIYQHSDAKPQSLWKAAKLEAERFKSILKMANTCAAKFGSWNVESNNFRFQKYCSKRLKKIFHPSSLHCDKKTESILETFDQMFYFDNHNNESVDGRIKCEVELKNTTLQSDQAYGDDEVKETSNDEIKLVEPIIKSQDRFAQQDLGEMKNAAVSSKQILHDYHDRSWKAEDELKKGNVLMKANECEGMLKNDTASFRESSCQHKSLKYNQIQTQEKFTHLDVAKSKDSTINPRQIIFQLQSNEDKVELKDKICQLDGGISSASEEEADMIERHELLNECFIESFEDDSNSIHSESSQDCNEDSISQLDGNVSEDGKEIKKTLFAIKCEEKDIVQLLSFFRNFDFLWNFLACHKLCLVKEECFLIPYQKFSAEVKSF